MKKNYLTISEIAKMTNLPIRTLHYYDEIDLFKPAYVDPQTNYRYYDESQMYQLDLIKSLKYIGTPLKSIKYAQTLTLEQLYEFLAEQEKIVEERVKQLLEVQQTLLKTKNLLGDQLAIPYYNEVYETTVTAQRLLAIKTNKLSVMHPPDEYFSSLIKTAEREGTILVKYGAIYPFQSYEAMQDMYYDYLFTPLLTERYVELMQDNEEVLMMVAGTYACIAFLFDGEQSYFDAYEKLYNAVREPKSPVYEVYMPASYSPTESPQYIVELKVKIA